MKNSSYSRKNRLLPSSYALIRRSARMYQRGSHWTDFHEICYCMKICRRNRNLFKIGQKLRPKERAFYCCRRRPIAIFERNGIRLLGQPRRYTGYANKPQCCVMPIVFPQKQKGEMIIIYHSLVTETSSFQRAPKNSALLGLSSSCRR